MPGSAITGAAGGIKQEGADTGGRHSSQFLCGHRTPSQGDGFHQRQPGAQTQFPDVTRCLIPVELNHIQPCQFALGCYQGRRRVHKDAHAFNPRRQLRPQGLYLLQLYLVSSGCKDKTGVVRMQLVNAVYICRGS